VRVWILDHRTLNALNILIRFEKSETVKFLPVHFVTPIYLMQKSKVEALVG